MWVLWKPWGGAAADDQTWAWLDTTTISDNLSKIR